MHSWERAHLLMAYIQRGLTMEELGFERVEAADAAAEMISNGHRGLTMARRSVFRAACHSSSVTGLAIWATLDRSDPRVTQNVGR
jgi:hypothetical protein